MEKSQDGWEFRVIHARNLETNRMAKQLPALNKKERKIIREAKRTGNVNHDGAW